MSDDTKVDQAPALPVADILGRLQRLYRAKSETELAGILGVPQSTLASWKKRESIPFGVLLWTSAQLNVTLDWLIFGKGAEDRFDMGRLDEKVLSLAIRAAIPADIIDENYLPKLASTVWRYYLVLSNTVEAFRTSGTADREAAFKVAQDTAESLRANVRLFSSADGHKPNRK